MCPTTRWPSWRCTVETAAGEVAEAARKLSAARAKAAGKLAKAVSAELGWAGDGQGALEVDVRPLAGRAQDSAPLDGRRAAAARRVERASTRWSSGSSAHAGAQALPISKSASGGELSRVMLALEVVLAGSDTGATMVFDEVDAGVGGRAAVEIGRRLARLARTHQVIVVTHLPQVAAFADTHLVVDKSDDGKGEVGQRSSHADRRRNEWWSWHACSRVWTTPRPVARTRKNYSKPPEPSGCLPEKATSPTATAGDVDFDQRRALRTPPMSWLVS